MKEYASKNDIVKLFLLFFLLTVLMYGCGYKPKPDWKPADITHEVVYSDSLRTLWSRSNVYIGASWGYLSLVASGGKVFMFGSIDIEESSSLNALDAFTNDLVWKSDLKPPSTLFADQGGLFIGESGGGGRVSRFDSDTGKVQWSRFFWYSSGVEHLLVYEDQLHAYLASDKHRILRISDGKTISLILTEQPPFFDSGVCGEVYQTPIYTVDTVYYRTNKGLDSGEVCAVDIFTGKLRWKSDLSIVSNVVATDDAVFVLIENGDLLALNPATGEEISALKISFDNKPFSLYEPQTGIGNYFVAYDAENKILFVYLGDSRQLFSFLVGEN